MPPPRIGLNVHVYPSPFEYESRILKVSRTLVARSIVERVLVIALAKDDLPEQQIIDGRRRVLRVDTWIKGRRLGPKILRLVEWGARVFLTLRHETVSMVSCHSLSVLPICVLLKWWHKTLLIYEPHELETETVTMKGWVQCIAKWVERSLIDQADRVIVVSDSIADHYRQNYQLSQAPVILNVPELDSIDDVTPNSLLRARFSIPDNHLVFMYQGVLDEARGVLWLLEAFRQVSSDRHLVFMGFGPLEERIRSAALTASNLHLHPAVPSGEIGRYTQGADVGVALLSNDCLNHRCALPNKLFHYLHAGLPVIVSDLDEMGALVDRYGCGWRVDNAVAALAACVSAIDPVAIESRLAGVLRAKDDLHWGREESKLEFIYGNLLPITRLIENGK